MSFSPYSKKSHMKDETHPKERKKTKSFLSLCSISRKGFDEKKTKHRIGKACRGATNGRGRNRTKMMREMKSRAQGLNHHPIPVNSSHK